MRPTIYIGVALGGGLGAVFRYLITHTFPYKSVFPLSTLIINLIGCFVLSFSYQFFKRYFTINLVFQKALTTGLIGSFTTFSAFTVEFTHLLNQSVGLSSLYIGLTVVGGLLMTFAGHKWGEKVIT
ncbi:fluoride efflux transporter FluC [Halobacillus yeomjeoni]|uniref:Fluoride-specific ion channel FluC n=1 Tax=Halobacillus yeomjeoni TaxID=311194 RepID=A0A931MW34_9BACI|nr:CrcB family protein [Halobacillus yeomjeoni]MBH0231001.1 CrcB family protein [Halobacillus yeomjeoni]